MSKIRKQELRTIHELFVEIADFADVELEDTEYRSHGVFPHSVNRNQEDHKKAVYLLSEAFAESREMEGIWTGLENWDYPSDPEPDISVGAVDYFSGSEKDRVVFDGDAEVEIAHNGRESYQWSVLEKLGNGEEFEDVLDQVYARNENLANRLYGDIYDDVVEDGVLPETYRSDLSDVVERYRSNEDLDERRTRKATGD